MKFLMGICGILLHINSYATLNLGIYFHFHFFRLLYGQANFVGKWTWHETTRFRPKRKKSSNFHSRGHLIFMKTKDDTCDRALTLSSTENYFLDHTHTYHFILFFFIFYDQYLEKSLYHINDVCWSSQRRFSQDALNINILFYSYPTSPYCAKHRPEFEALYFFV
jgi:hypothetical protein